MILRANIDKYKDTHTVSVFGGVHVPEWRKLGIGLYMYNNLTQLLADGDIKFMKHPISSFKQQGER